MGAVFLGLISANTYPSQALVDQVGGGHLFQLFGCPEWEEHPSALVIEEHPMVWEGVHTGGL